MARFTLLVAVVVGLACLLGHSSAVPVASGKIGSASQIPSFPSPGDIPKPPGMLHSRVVRDIPQEIPGQDQFPAPPPPPQPPQMPSMRSRRDVSQLKAPEHGLEGILTRGKRSPKGTGGKLPRKAG